MPKSVSIGRPIEEGLLDEIDAQFLTLITRGYYNSYAIYHQLMTEAEKKGTRTMLYKNTNRRILLLAKTGVIEEIKYTERTPHGRIDYKLTLKGFKALLSYMFSHPNEAECLARYVDDAGLDKAPIVDQVVKKLASTVDAANRFLTSLQTEADYTEFLRKHKSSQHDLEEALSREIRNTVERMRRLVESFNSISKDKELWFQFGVNPGSSIPGDEGKKREELQSMLPDVKQTTAKKRHSTPTPLRMKRKTE